MYLVRNRRNLLLNDATMTEQQQADIQKDEEKPIIALIYGDGEINMQYDKKVHKAFDEAIKHKNVKAIVFRVESPGGSSVYSETIYRQVHRAKKAGKPVFVSMGHVAASGGYYVAMGADKIVAEPATITGSIGVFANKLIIGKFLEGKLGITFDSLHEGDHALINSSIKDFTPSERERIEKIVDYVYNEFTSKVAENRKLTPEEVDKCARGRVFTGEQAKQLGLVDELGGIDKTIEIAHTAIKQDCKVEIFPPRKRLAFFEMLNYVNQRVIQLGLNRIIPSDLQLMLDILESYDEVKVVQVNEKLLTSTQPKITDSLLKMQEFKIKY